MLLGCIGDDFTGSSDLANTLAKGGMRTTQYVGIPDLPADADVEAGVVSLKSRSIAADEAVQLSLEALRWLQAQGCQQFLFKICSTFDSTKDGNIGPVAEALADALDAERVIVCPAFPTTGRTVFQGHLFVGDVLLSESGMRDHPLTPMTDSDLRRWLSHQTSGTIGHVSFADVNGGADRVRSALKSAHEAGHRLLIADAVRDADLRVLGTAARDERLLFGGSGIALGLPDNFRETDALTGGANVWRGQSGKCAILSGSCSVATRAQLDLHIADNPSMEIIVPAVIDGSLDRAEVVDFVLQSEGLPVVYSSASPEQVTAYQEEFGQAEVAEALESFFAKLARDLVESGVERLIVAGGETSGAVVEGLDLAQFQIGPEIDPGVPALRARDDLVVALKSGNFGAPDFFTKAAQTLAADA